MLETQFKGAALHALNHLQVSAEARCHVGAVRCGLAGVHCRLAVFHHSRTALALILYNSWFIVSLLQKKGMACPALMLNDTLTQLWRSTAAGDFLLGCVRLHVSQTVFFLDCL